MTIICILLWSMNEQINPLILVSSHLVPIPLWIIWNFSRKNICGTSTIPQCGPGSGLGPPSDSPWLCGALPGPPVPLCPPFCRGSAGLTGAAPTQPWGLELWKSSSEPVLAPSAPAPASRPPPNEYNRHYCPHSLLPAAQSSEHRRIRRARTGTWGMNGNHGVDHNTRQVIPSNDAGDFVT